MGFRYISLNEFKKHFPDLNESHYIALLNNKNVIVFHDLTIKICNAESESSLNTDKRIFSIISNANLYKCIWCCYKIGVCNKCKKE